MKKPNALDRAWDRARGFATSVPRELIEDLCSSRDSRQRLLGIVLMRREIERGVEPREYLKLAATLAGESENNCRWQSLIVVGESIASAPDEVWRVVRDYGDSGDEDMRTAIAKVLLEHLIAADFDTFFSGVRELVSEGRYGFLDTLDRCSSLQGLTDEQRRRMTSYIRTAGRGLGLR